MSKTNELLSAVENKSALVVNSVSIEDTDKGVALIIRFTSDGDERTKTMPLTNDGLKVREKLENLLADKRFDPNFIWDMIKYSARRQTALSGMLVGLVRDLAKEAEEKVSGLANDFASLRLSADKEDIL